jgi:7-carboxy-7-deazaguanine synthase
MALSKRAIGHTAKERMAPLRVLQESTDELLIHEIYYSLQGEGSRAGLPCTFVRLTGCHLRCHYCDTESSFLEGQQMGRDDVIAKVMDLGASLVQITGGEPLLQKAVYGLMKKLCDAGCCVVLETSGALSVRHVDKRVVIILDVKTPSSGEEDRNHLENLAKLRPSDEIKFVISDKADYQFAQDFLREAGLLKAKDMRPTILFSPESDTMSPTQLAEWMISDRLDVRFQLQMHKVLWGARKGV